MSFRIILVAALLSFCGTTHAQVGLFSQGKRFGILSKFSYKGWVLKSWEGEMMVGNESTHLEVKKCDSNNNCDTVILNPWYFSVDSKNTQLLHQLQEAEGKYVVLTYDQAQIGGLSYSTDYMIQSVAYPDPNLTVTTCRSNTAKGKFSTGSRVGRIVKISSKGNFTKSWEIKIQVGTNGNEFVDMSVTDPAMVPCMENYLGSGKVAKISYRQAYLVNPLNRDTDYDVDVVEELDASPGLEQ